MLYREFVQNIRKAGLTIKEFALLIKVTPTAITNYSKADRIPNHLVIISTLMRELGKNDIDFKIFLENIASDLTPTLPRVTEQFGGNKKESPSKDIVYA